MLLCSRFSHSDMPSHGGGAVALPTESHRDLGVPKQMRDHMRGLRPGLLQGLGQQALVLSCQALLAPLHQRDGTWKVEIK